MDATTGQQVAEAFWFVVWTLGILLFLWWFITAPEGGETPVARFRRYITFLVWDKRVMSYDDEDDRVNDTGRTRTEDWWDDRAAPDTDAIHASSARRSGSSAGSAIRISRRMNDAELIALLAVQRTETNAYKYSANKIATLIGGTREDVLSQIRAIRSLPQYPPLSDEERSVREYLELS